MMWLLPMSEHPGLVMFVIQRMRDWDRREIFATPRFQPTDEGLLEAIMAAGDVSWIAGDGEEPIAVFGCTELWSGVWSMWFFATDTLNKIGLSVTKFVRRSIIPSLLQGGAHRLECRSMDGHAEAQKWLGTLGAVREGTLQGYGRDREDFHVYVWPAGGL
jgi:hypothetical protein